MKPETELWIGGSRSFQDTTRLRQLLEGTARWWLEQHGRSVEGTLILTGGAIGIDSMAASPRFQLTDCAGQFVLPADWIHHGKAAGFIRNKELARRADLALFIWDGASPGTRHSISMARQRGTPTLVLTPGKETLTP